MYIQSVFLFLLSLAFPPVDPSLSIPPGHISIYFFNFFITIMKCKEDFGLDGDGEPLCIVCSLHTYEQCSTISVFRM
ncbi:hypothetical protein EDC04DRAFT_2783810 [Pisolithus marmoratus]|nr:hypothetical protein EDC04DRAFT_2783810 [Pisolithus marmoratus]